ncbi:MAG: WecB/TagA/CpsF family glycosyltransferase [Proteobacteria bacterium]|nr:WecB/TagA/CpsF family glycosyltransferase [Pseudomonadota bacterium]MCP4915476.1 WecB/TagA/CpsF family glycosyltransferase [Pseudomonadota bacterium]
MLDKAGLLDEVASRIAASTPTTVAYLNVHVMNTAARDEALSDFLRSADLCYADGAGVVLGARILGHELPERMTGADWIWDLAAEAEGRWRIAWIGGEPGVSEEAARVLRERHPDLELLAEHGFHDDNPALCERVNAWKPDLVLVGMGTPVQERWTSIWRGHLDAPVVWCLGATADFVSGKVDRGPAWLHDNQEWLARLLTEPGRLWRRYLLGNPLFLARVVRERITGPRPSDRARG